MQILDGKKLNAEIDLQLKSEVEGFLSMGLPTPKLVIFQLGDNPASNIYVKRKAKFAEKISAICEVVKLPIETTQEELLKLVTQQNENKNVHGIILQLPAGENINSEVIFNNINPKKDVDGLGEVNLSKLLINDNSGIVPATARGIATLLEKNDINISGKKVAIIGRSVLVGKSTALNLLNKDATVTICHSKTENVGEIIKSSDIIVSATGEPGLIKKEYIRPEHIIVDVGISLVDEKIVGDVDVEFQDKKPKYISPVPGGVGPMTVISLFSNLIDAYKNQNNL